jgi:hypothetical protein
MKKQDVLNRVLNSESSIFAKDDVVRLIEMVEGEGRTITVTDIGAAIDSAMNVIAREGRDLVVNSAEFELNGNEICLSSVELDINYIREQMEDKLMPLGEAGSEN